MVGEIGTRDMLRHREATNHEPFVGLERLPTDEGGPTARRERTPKVCERGHGVVEEHDPEPTDDDVEGTFGKGVGLRVWDYELGIVDRR